MRDVRSGFVLIIPKDEENSESKYAMKFLACSSVLLKVDCDSSLKICVYAANLSLEFAAPLSAV